MKVEKLLATAPADGQYADLIRSAYEDANPTAWCAALAYATQSGVAELTATLDELNGWSKVRKRWLVGVDYCRSDPLALAHLDGLPRSQVRIFDGDFVLSRAGCIPRRSYHPKVYLLRGEKSSTVVVGSGNLSRTGLRFGVEAAASISGPMESDILDMRSWFRRHWGSAPRFQALEEQYERRYGSADNRRRPVPVEDDDIPASATNAGQLRPEDLRKLRVCRNLWIQAGNLHLNRGPTRPGNQLMLKRNSRVFFGFSARDLKPDSLIGSVAIRFGGHLRSECPMRFSNNAMDVLTLPVPSSEGPERYDQETLHFKQVGVREFELTLALRHHATRWKRRSQSIEGAFGMKSGREWGVY